MCVNVWYLAYTIHGKWDFVKANGNDLDAYLVLALPSVADDSKFRVKFQSNRKI